MNTNESPVSTEKMLPIEAIASANIEFVDEVIELSERAKKYLDSMKWCGEIVRGWLDYACGYVIGIFYFQIVPSRPNVPHFVWVIVGDIPPAYMDGEFDLSSSDALQSYICEMQEWVDRVLDGRPIDDDVIPVNVPPEKEWAERLQSRLKHLREFFLEGNQLVDR